MAWNILIVDDSATTRGMIKRILRMCGLPIGELFEAGNGLEALEMLGSVKVDLVLADLHMPQMTGIELTRRILGDPATRELPVVIISAEPSAGRIAELQKEGIRGYLRKPFTPEALRNVINNVLGVVHA